MSYATNRPRPDMRPPKSRLLLGANPGAVALRTAEVARQPAHANGNLVRLAASGWVAIVGRVGCHGHLQTCHAKPNHVPKQHRMKTTTPCIACACDKLTGKEVNPPASSRPAEPSR